MAKKNIKDLVAGELSDFLKENEYELYNLEFVKEGKDWFLRLYIDRTEDAEGGGISTDDCEKVSRFLSARMDELDPIEQNYYLEVSSPGMDRALLKERDYARYAGQYVDITLYQGLNGKKAYFGKLEGLIDGNVVITDEKNNKIEIPIEKVAKTKLAVIF
jgi:Uncharacterized protein conserved in bacteria